MDEFIEECLDEFGDDDNEEVEEHSPPLSGVRLNYVISQNRAIAQKLEQKEPMSEVFPNGSFWITPTDPLLLTEGEKLKPEKYILPRLFVFIPKAFGVKITCPVPMSTLVVGMINRLQEEL